MDIFRPFLSLHHGFSSNRSQEKRLKRPIQKLSPQKNYTEKHWLDNQRYTACKTRIVSKSLAPPCWQSAEWVGNWLPRRGLNLIKVYQKIAYAFINTNFFHSSQKEVWNYIMQRCSGPLVWDYCLISHVFKTDRKRVEVAATLWLTQGVCYSLSSHTILWGGILLAPLYRKRVSLLLM